MTTRATLAEANAVLALFAPYTRLEQRRGGIWLVTRYGAARMSLRPQGTWPQANTGRLGLGGTDTTSIVQLVRWLRGQTRRPVAFWRARYGDEVADALEGMNYADPAATRCVLCGAAGREVWDWWARPGDERLGPCCGFNECAPFGVVAEARERAGGE